MTSHLTYSLHPPCKERKKTQLRIPESHALYVCPPACARRFAIRAHKNGIASTASFLQLTEADLVSGAYEKQVIEAVGMLLETLPKQPRALQIFVNCVDDFLGTDNDALKHEIESAFPALRVSIAHINPIARDVDNNSIGKMLSGLYSLLEAPEQHDVGITTLGSFVPISYESELYAALAEFRDKLNFNDTPIPQGEIPVRHVVTCETFEEYQQLSKSAIVLSLSNSGDRLAETFKDEFGMACVQWHATYSIETVENNYTLLINALVQACLRVFKSVSSDARSIVESGTAVYLFFEKFKTHTAVNYALDALGDMPIYVDSAATFEPYTLALNLLDYGFNVKAVYAFHLKGSRDSARNKLKKAYPKVKIYTDADDFELHNKAAKKSVSAAQGAKQEALAIGADCAFITSSKYVLDMYHDEGYFGYNGIQRLMCEMMDAVKPSGEGSAKQARKQKQCSESGA